jgi:transcription initiation factor TFIIIB Brf1 subunit/transcription initiation factor TFIIB
MTDFALFEQALANYNQNKHSIEDPFEPNESCTHSIIISDRGAIKCVDCGEEVDKDLTYDREWRWYGGFDNRNSSDPNRVQPRKSGIRNIDDDVKNMGFGDKIVSEADKIYSDVTKKEIYRGNFRKAIIFACIFQAYKMVQDPQSHEKLISIFGLNRKTSLRGLKFVSQHAAKNAKFRTIHISPINLVEEIMDRFSATAIQKAEVIKLYNRIVNRSSKLNRSRPQSIAEGLTFYWICSKNKNISIKEFTTKVSLSEITIGKIAREIASILGTPNVL